MSVVASLSEVWEPYPMRLFCAPDEIADGRHPLLARTAFWGQRHT
jgi:hypothetical protein